MQQEPIILNGRYELQERIGSGGMAIVYKAKDRALGRVVAVKIMQESLTDDEEFLRRFQREAHAAANLTHPNIVTVHDIGQDGRKHYIVMEIVEGLTLKQIIRGYNEDGRLMPVSRAVDLATEICTGIGYAHRAQLVHCDIKPHNILVTRDDRVKVADFGIAQAMSQLTSQNDDSRIWGTPQYFAPEQAAGETATPASDVYSIGVTLFEMLTGSLPFKADTPTAVAVKHLQEQAPLVSDLNPDVPSPLVKIVAKVLSKEPSARYRTAGQLGRILNSYRKQTVTPAITPLAENTPVSEQKTQVYRRPAPVTPSVEASPAVVVPVTEADEDADTRPLPKRASPPFPKRPLENENEDMDWTAITLGMMALAALLGLIPLWYFVYRAWAG